MREVRLEKRSSTGVTLAPKRDGSPGKRRHVQNVEKETDPYYPDTLTQERPESERNGR